MAFTNAIRLRLPSLILGALLFAAIIVPFALFGERMEAWSLSLLENPANKAMVALAVFALLCLDVFLPLPSSLLAVGAGALLGFPLGTVTVWLGLVCANLLGYGIGKHVGAPALARFGSAELTDETGRSLRFGLVALVTTRGVPVLAEAVPVVTGVRGMRLTHFLAATVPANLGIALVYAWLGSVAADRQSFLLVFAASVLVPALAFLFYRGIGRLRQDG